MGILLRRISFLLTAFCLLSMQNAGWYVEKSISGGFSIEFPQKPKEMKMDPNKDMPYALNVLACKGAGNNVDENLFYIFMHSTPIDSSGKMNNEEVKVFLDNAINSFIKGVDGKLISDESTSFKRNSGRKVYIKIDEGRKLQVMHIYVINNKLFTLIVKCNSDKVDNKSMVHFFNSFELSE